MHQTKLLSTLLFFCTFYLSGQTDVTYQVQNDNESAILGVATSANPNTPSFASGVRGISQSANGIGTYGNGVTGARGDGTVVGLYGFGPRGVWGVQSGGGVFAGDFDGNVDVSGTFTNPSDRKLKTIYKNSSLALPKILQLKPTYYKHKTDVYPMMNLRKGDQLGFIAQELEQIFPRMVSEVDRPEIFDADGNSIAEKVTYKAVNYIDMIPVLTQGIQELNATLESQSKIIQSLKEELAILKRAQ